MCIYMSEIHGPDLACTGRALTILNSSLFIYYFIKYLMNVI